MANENFRVQDKGNVHRNGRKTSFKLFEKSSNAFVFAGQFFAMGWDLTDDQCISEATWQIAEDDNEQMHKVCFDLVAEMVKEENK